MYNVNEIVLRMREAVGVSSDEELGERLNGNPKTSTISNWKVRGSIPYPYIDQLTRETGRGFEWFLSGNDMKSLIPDLPVPYQGNKNYPPDLRHIIDEWPSLTDTQKDAVMSVMNAFSKQNTSSLEIKERVA